MKLLVASISVVALCVSLVTGFLGALRIGVSWDEPVELERFQRVFTAVMTSRQVSSQAETQDFAYGLVYQWLGHVFNVLRGNEVWGTVSQRSDAYAVRHLTVYFLGVFCLFVIGIGTSLLTKSRLTGLLAAAILSVLPVWMGHTYMNPKDVPVAVGFTCTSMGFALLLSPQRSNRVVQGPVGFLVLSLLVIGTVLSVGNRFGFWLVVVAQALLVLAIAIVNFIGRSKGIAVLMRQFTLVTVSLLLGFFLVLALHPHLWGSLKQLPQESVSLSARFGQEAWTLTYGQLLGAQALPAWYLPTWLWAGTPILIGVFAVYGFFTALMTKELRATFSPIFFQLTALPVFAVLTQAPLYDAQRHQLFVFPALAIVASLGLSKTLLAMSDCGVSMRRRSVREGLVICAVGVTFFAPLYAQIKLFPYSYVYLNPVATATGEVSETWETDYWATSFREGITKVPEGGEFDLWGPGNSYLPFAHLRGSSAEEVDLNMDSFWWLKLNRNGEAVRVPATCSVHDRVERILWNKAFVMSSVYQCEKLEQI